MHYALCINFPANQVGFAKILCIITFMHYHVMRYENFNCMLIMIPKRPQNFTYRTENFRNQNAWNSE
jgi:hypothetical protein